MAAKPGWPIMIGWAAWTWREVQNLIEKLVRYKT